jgi:TolA-binding protein
MNTNPDDWDQDEQQALKGLEDQIETIRRRHAGNPPIEWLRAARAEALPEELQTSVTTHLSQNAWSRALVEGLEAGGDAPALDRVSEERLWNRIRRQALAGPVRAGWRGKRWAYGGAALAASLLIAVSVFRNVDAPASLAPPAPSAPAPTAPAPTAPAPTAPAPSAPAPSAPLAPLALSFQKPDIKLTTAALTWRGAPAENPFLLNLKPAVDAYRDGDYEQADARFAALALQYPQSVEVQFFLGVTRMLRDDFTGAIAPLTSALALQEPTFVDDASWFLAVAEQRSGNTAAASRRLRDLCAGTGAFTANACQAADQLRAAEATARP